MQCFKSEVIDGLVTDQRGGEPSSAGVGDESGNLPRGAAFARLSRGLQTPRFCRRFRVWPADCSNESGINTDERYKTFAQVKCVSST